MTPFHVFIISWAGQHENAIDISNDVLSVTDRVSIVYSDPDPEIILNAACQLIRRSNDLFWEDKFKSCLAVCGDSPILIIHADCKCDNWSAIIKSCTNSCSQIERIGVWTPKINGTYWDLSVTKIGGISDSNLSIVALTDAIVFYLSSDVIDRMRKVDYGSNPFGWGIDLLFCTAAHVSDYLVVVDESIEISHPKLTGYDSNSARVGMANFFKQFSLRERVQVELLTSFVKFNYLRLSKA